MTLRLVRRAPQFVQGMGLFSATAIVMGSMIGSGIFIVSADMSRTLGSPALLIAAWLVTAAMTIIGALSYGELAAMMPKAGGQYVYLRESLGPLWGFLYGWTLFLVIQTGTIAAVGVAFGKFLGVFFPSVSQTVLASWHVGEREHRAEYGEPGGDCGDYAADGAEYAGREAGRGGAERVYECEGAGAGWAWWLVGLVAKNAVAIAANFGAGWHEFLGGGGIGDAASRSTLARSSGRRRRRAMVGVLTVVAVVQVGSLFSSDAWNNVTFTAGEIREPEAQPAAELAIGTGVVLLLYIACNFVYLSVLPMAAIRDATTIAGAASVCGAGPGGDGGDGAGVRRRWARS